MARTVGTRAGGPPAVYPAKHRPGIRQRKGCRISGAKPGIAFALVSAVRGFLEQEGVMAHAIAARRIVHEFGRLLEHAAAIVIGLVLMVVGLGLGVTMIMLPVGVVVGLIGVALVVGGIFARIDER
jgi:hypothetical protein